MTCVALANTNALVLGPRSSTLSSARRSGGGGIAFALLLGMLPEAACLPVDDLSTYSSAGAAGSLQPRDAAPDGSLGDGGDRRSDTGAGALPDAGGLSSGRSDAGAAGPELDAGAGLAAGDGGAELDAGELDAALVP